METRPTRYLANPVGLETYSKNRKEKHVKARLVPVYFDGKRDEEFDEQVQRLEALLAEQAELLAPVGLGEPLPEAEAVVFPQLLGEAYRHVAEIGRLGLPILIITSEFGTLSMWDWEITSYLRSEGIETIAPYNLAQTHLLCRALSVRRELKETRFLVYQDNPGKGFQASIFKRFYWWEDECTQRMLEKFGVRLVKKSFQALGEEARAIPDEEAQAALREKPFPQAGLSQRALFSAMKIYLAVRRELDRDSNIRAVGINCLNESHFSDTTPCLAWNLLFEERRLLWGCEADSMSMLTEHILYHTLQAPLMMSNLYPFVMGQAALKHEHIPHFPDVPEPHNCILVAHCGYLGVLPRSFATEWTLRPKVLAIVDENASAIDARLPEGPVTLAKLSPTLGGISLVEGQIERYVQYADSDCLNGALIRVPDGPRLVNRLDSHHSILVSGHHRQDIELVAPIFGLKVDWLA
jgi:hypothetical protein